MSDKSNFEYKGWSARAQLIYKRTYARPLNTAQTSFEDWDETVARAVSHQRWLWERALGCPLNSEQELELNELHDLMLNRQIFLAGRTLWLGGTDISRTREVSQFNCAGTEVETVYDVVDFLWCLLNGAGVGGKPRAGILNGFSRPIEDIEVIRSTITIDEFNAGKRGRETNAEVYDPLTGIWTISVGDSSEAWAKAIGKLLASKYPARRLVLDFSQVRPAGVRLSNYGWICSGDENISKAMVAIARILSRRADQLLSKIDIMDVLNWLGTSLSSRRAAQIMLMDFHDPEWEEFALAKMDYYQRGQPQRGQSNNSLIFWERPSRAELRGIFSMITQAGGSEPGFINGREAQRRAPWFRTVNPCFAGSQRLLLPTGYVTMKEAYEQQGHAQFGDDYSTIQVVNRSGVVPATQVYKTGSDVEVFDVTLRSGKRIRATANHSFILTNEQRVQLKDLEVGDELFTNQQRHFGAEHRPAYALLAGLFVGDGSFSGNTAKLRVWNDDIELVGPSITVNAKHYYEVEQAGQLSTHPSHQKTKFDLTPQYKEAFDYTRADFTSQVLANQLIADGVVVGDKHRVPASIWRSDAETVGRFLSGLFSADGHFQYNASKQSGAVVLTQANRTLLEDVQLLLEQLGIVSRIYSCQPERTSLLNDGAGSKKEYVCQQSWRLMIMNRESIARFYNDVEFIQSTKQQQVLDYLNRHKGSNNSGNRYRDEVVSVEYAGREDTYCLTEPASNEVVVNGVVIGQCAEILLTSKSFCNLVEVVVSAFTDAKQLARAIWVAARANYRQTCVNLEDGVLQEAWHLNNRFLRLCGVGLTGIVLRPDLTAADYQYFRTQAVSGTDSMADELGLPRAKNVCTVKPSGTLSKVADTTEGGHKPMGKYNFNRVIFAKEDPLVDRLRQAGYRIEPHPDRSSEVLVVFPVAYENVEFDVVVKDGKRMEVNLESAVAQLERYKMLQQNWTEHNTSITVSYSLHEVPAMVDWLHKNWDHYVGVSFIYRTDPTVTPEDVGYSYLPQAVVTKEEYEAYVAQLRPVTLGTIDSITAPQDDACSTGMCPTR